MNHPAAIPKAFQACAAHAAPSSDSQPWCRAQASAPSPAASYVPPPDLDLTVYGYSVTRLEEGLAAAGLHSQALPAAASSNAINIMNLHLAGDFDVRHGARLPPPIRKAAAFIMSVLGHTLR